MSINLLPDEIVLHLCLKMNIVDFIHLSMTSHRYYKFREDIFKHKTRLVISFSSNKVSRRLMKPSVQRCMEQSSEQPTTDLPVEEIAEFCVNLNDLKCTEEVIENFSVFTNITQMIVIGMATSEHMTDNLMIHLLPLFAQLSMLKMIFYTCHFSSIYHYLNFINLPNLRHLNLFTRYTPPTESYLYHYLTVKSMPRETRQMLLQLNELYIGGYPTKGKEFLELISKEANQLRRLGIYGKTIDTCLNTICEMESSLNVTHLTMNSTADDYDSLSNEQLQLISRRFPAVQHFIPDTVERKINYRQIQQ